MVTASAPYMAITFPACERTGPACSYALGAGWEKTTRTRMPNTGAVHRRLRLPSLNIVTRISFCRQCIIRGLLPRAVQDAPEREWTARNATSALGIDAATAKQVVAELALMGYIEPVPTQG